MPANRSPARPGTTPGAAAPRRAAASGPALARLLRPPVPKARGRRRVPAEPATSLTTGRRDPIGSAGGAVAQLGER